MNQNYRLANKLNVALHAINKGMMPSTILGYLRQAVEEAPEGLKRRLETARDNYAIGKGHEDLKQILKEIQNS